MARLGLFRELRRRHVFRVAIAYAVTAWLLLQLAAIVLPTFGAPHWVLKVLIGVFLLCFPLAIMLAWAFEVTPEGVRRTVPAESEEARPGRYGRRIGQVLNVGIIVVLAAAVGVLAWRLSAVKSKPQPTHVAAAAVSTAPAVASAPAAGTVIPAKSIAVLPFENLSADKNNAYFAAGMREEILTRLADLGGLLVISSTSSSRFSSKPADLSAVARELGVATVLEGSVQKAGNQVLVDVQLIDARTDNHLWAESYQRTLSNVFGVEGEVAQKVAGALEAQLTAAQEQQITTPATTNPQVYDAYLRGRAYESSAEAIAPFAAQAKARAAYRDAVRLDPNFAPAWARLAYLDLNVYWFKNRSPQQLATAKQALDKALALAPEAGETLLAQGYYYYWGLSDYPRALAAFERALPKLPNSADALQSIAFVERRQGHWDDALMHLHQAIERDPLNTQLLTATALTYTAIREFPIALALFDRAIALSPGNQFDIANKASVYQAEGDLAAANKVLEGIDFDSADTYTRLTVVYQRGLERDYSGAIRLLRAALAKPAYTISYETSIYNFYLGFFAQLAGDPHTARVAWLQAQSEAETALRATHDPFLYGGLGMIEASLGNKAAALDDGRHAIALLPASKDALYGPELEIFLAQIETQIGEHEKAVAILRHLLSIPSFSPITVPLLRLDPTWDPLRKDPAFQALLDQRATVAPSAASIG